MVTQRGASETATELLNNACINYMLLHIGSEERNLKPSIC
jgi:hypothetical protein